MLHAVIIAGGRGERFWPASRRGRPKQFLRLVGQRSLIELTSQRISPLCPIRNQTFIVPRELRPVLRRALPRLPARNVVTEPCGRNTAAAIGLASFRLRKPGKVTQVVLPADHLIRPRSRFLEGVRFAERVARTGKLVLFGIPPTRPDTGYGYIRLGERLATGRRLVAYEARSFEEKPNAATARRYLRSGRHLWNSGMFVWQNDTILEGLRAHMPALYEDLAAWAAGRRKLASVYARAVPISIDYGVLEKAHNVAVVRVDFNWDDVGSWLALDRQGYKDLDKNSVFARFCGIDTRNSIIYGEDSLVATLGVKDLIVVQTKDAVLVCHKTRAADLKKLTSKISSNEATRGYL